MIKMLYESFLQVSNFERAIEFYHHKLGLPIELYNAEVKTVHFTIGSIKNVNRQMLGIQEVEEVNIRHIAFGVDLDDIYKAKEWLNARGIESRKVFKRDGSEPIVHTQDPAASIYFNDPDGNKLELFTFLPGEPMKLPYVPLLSEWDNLTKQP